MHRTGLQDISPLENMHVAKSYQVAYANPGANFAESLTPDAQGMLRANCIELILGEAEHCDAHQNKKLCPHHQAAAHQTLPQVIEHLTECRF